MDENTTFENLSHRVAVEPAQSIAHLNEIHEQLFGRGAPDYLLFHVGGCFAASAAIIRSRTVDFYRNALATVRARPEAGDALDRLWPALFAGKPRTRGVVTAADAPYFPNLQLLVQSLQSSGAPLVAVFDLGLQADQRAWLLDRPNVICVEPPQIDAALQPIMHFGLWQSWLKPVFLFHSPFDCPLWVDADAIVIGDLEEAFSLIERTALLTPDRFGPETQNDASLYEFLPLAEGVSPGQWGLNAGVVGLCKRRDSDLLAAWVYAVRWAAEHQGQRHLIRWCDQGALIWAIYQARREHEVRSDFRWNYPACAEPNLVASAKAHGRTLRGELRARFPGIDVLHWYGTDKLSYLLRRELGDDLSRSFSSLALHQE